MGNVSIGPGRLVYSITCSIISLSSTGDFFYKDISNPKQLSGVRVNLAVSVNK